MPPITKPHRARRVGFAGDADARWHVLIDYRLAGAETGLDVAKRIRARYGDPAFWRGTAAG